MGCIFELLSFISLHHCLHPHINPCWHGTPLVSQTSDMQITQSYWQKSEQKLQHTIDELDATCEQYGMTMNAKKINTMIVDKTPGSLCREWLKHVPRRGFRGECCPPTALHRLYGHRNDKISTCRRCWPFVNIIRKRKHSELREVWC